MSCLFPTVEKEFDILLWILGVCVLLRHVHVELCPSFFIMTRSRTITEKLTALRSLLDCCLTVSSPLDDVQGLKRTNIKGGGGLGGARVV